MRTKRQKGNGEKRKREAKRYLVEIRRRRKAYCSRFGFIIIASQTTLFTLCPPFYFIPLGSSFPRPHRRIDEKKTRPRYWPAGPKGDLTPRMLTKHEHPLESPSACVRTNVWSCTRVPNRAHPRYFFSLSLPPSPSPSLSLGLHRSLGAR